MDTALVKRKFAKIGATAEVAIDRRRTLPWEARKFLSKEQRRSLRRGVPERLAVDVEEGKDGERFVIGVNADVATELDMSILDIQPGDRHLLLMVKDASEAGVRQKFLCGHDERHWFVAAVPEDAGVATVRQAKEALKPEIVVAAQDRRGVKRKSRNKRRNAGFVRQGEWFFVPAPEMDIDDWVVLRNEPLQRGRGKPHVAEFAYRRGGETVHVSSGYPDGLIESQYAQLVRRRPEKRRQNWRVMRRDPEVFVKGRIRHPDHKTIVLRTWCRVVPNTENRASASSNVAFLD